MPRDLDLTFDISTGALTLDRVVGNYVKRSETLTLSVTIVSNGASATIPSGLVGTLKPVNTYGTTLAQWTTFSQVGATNVYTASTTINAAAVTTLLGTTTEQANCVFDFAGAGVVESDTLALILKNNVTRDDDTAPTALLNRNDFLVTNGTGLLVNVAAGYAANGAFVAAQAALAITNATNYIEVTAAGVASVNTTAFTAGSYPLATVVASAGAITANTDLRAWITPKPAAAGGVTSITGTANEITVTGTTTPTLSLPSALTFTGKTITGGTFASPTLTTPTIGDGTEAAPSLSFTGDTDTGVYRPAANTVGIVGGGNDVVRLTGIASATDYIEIKNGIGVGSPLHVLAEGASANIGVHLQPKGSGLFTISDGTDFNKGIRFRSSSSAASAITLLDAVSTAGRVITLPDATGTLALVSGDLGTPSALVGTNITGTASGLTAGNATLAATVTVANEATDTTCFPLFATAATGSLAAMSNAGLTFNSATRLLSATGLAGEFNGTVGATTPSSVAGTTGTFSGSVSTTGNFAEISTSGEDAAISTTGEFANIFTSGNDASISTSGATAHISTGGASAYIQTRSTFKLNGGTFVTTLSHAATADRAIAFPDAPGTLLLADGSGANLTTLNASNISSGTLAAARLSANVPLKDAANTFTGTTNTFTLPTTTGTTTTSGIAIAGNSLTTGTGIYLASSSLTSGKALDIQVSGTAAAASQTALNVATAGANGTSGITSKGAVISNTHTGTTSTNVALELTASGGTTNTALNVTAGSVMLPGSATITGASGAATITAAGTNQDIVMAPSGNGTYTASGFEVQQNAMKARFHSDATFVRMYFLPSATAPTSANYSFASSGSFAYFQAGTSQEFQIAASTRLQILLASTTSANPLTCSSTLAVTGATTLTGNLTSNGALISTPQALTGAGAVNVTTLTTAVTTTAPAQALTLANGTNGQIKTIVHQALSGGGTWVLTPTTKTGYTTITSTAVGETCTLQFFTTIGWCILSLRGAIAA